MSEENPNHLEFAIKSFALFFLVIMAVGEFVNAQTQPTNAGFENWTGSPPHPAGWVGVDNIIGVTGDNLTQDLTTFVEGASSAKLKTDSVSHSFLSEGDLRYGTGVYVASPPSITYYNTPFTSRPDSITFSYKLNSVGGDSAEVHFELTRWSGSRQEIANFDANALTGIPLTNTSNTWIAASYPVRYLSGANPDTINLAFHSAFTSQHLGTTVWIDKVRLAYNNVGIMDSKPIRAEMNLFSNSSAELLYFSNVEDFSGSKAEVFDFSGRLIISVILENNSLSVSSLEKGNYFLKLSDKAGNTHDGRFEVMR